MASIVRVITDSDIERVLEIYQPYILDTASTFELTSPSLNNFKQRVFKTLESYPWLVFEENGILKGYCYASAHRSREAYQWSVETSVYVDGNYRGQGVGKKLYESLLYILKKQGIANVYAGITLPNEPSVAFHKAFNFKKVGVYEKIGSKFGKWHDVIWYSLRLSEEARPPLPFSKIETALSLPKKKNLLKSRSQLLSIES